MNHWPFIMAAYGLTFLGSVGVTLWTYLAMRRSENALNAMEQER